MCIALAALSGCGEDAAHVHDTPSDQAPVDQGCVEVDGRLRCAPLAFEVDDALAVTIVGLADMDAVAQLAPAGLRPVSVSGPFIKTGLVILSAIDYRDTSIGAYREFVVQVLVQPDGPADVYYPSVAAYFAGLAMGDTDQTRAGNYLPILTLDGEGDAVVVAVETGRAYGGFAKFYGDVVLRPEPWSTPGFSVGQVASDGPDFEIHAELRALTPAPAWAPVSTMPLLVADGHGAPCWMTSALSGEFAAEVFDLDDELVVTGWLDTLLDELGFLPAGWGLNRARGIITIDRDDPACMPPPAD